ncbi:mediator of RNA polymerase II transcription subunit 10 isoform X2 [Daktulosphaira vitifoliae]|uniref:mediator of RNA polymerase II transcription subunit 10 isoform X2 n=1 Tax=Daktulosphaira vitifoliae TaxID=58002 RepID=UPI0021AAA708|nr:mediator of RNA polymerase II transcription subunit 10 isoform X2 [Daktulosphaira vitifoliae]
MTASSAAAAAAASLEDLETQLEMFVENVRQIRIIVTDFQPQGQTVLNQKIQNAVQGLQEINKLKSAVQDIHVPLEVFDYIDRGRNPQLYTKDCIEKALNKNEQVKGKIDALRKFKAQMLADLGHAFPNELTKYRALRSSTIGSTGSSGSGGGNTSTGGSTPGIGVGLGNYGSNVVGSGYGTSNPQTSLPPPSSSSNSLNPGSSLSMGMPNTTESITINHY